MKTKTYELTFEEIVTIRDALGDKKFELSRKRGRHVEVVKVLHEQFKDDAVRFKF